MRSNDSSQLRTGLIHKYESDQDVTKPVCEPHDGDRYCCCGCCPTGILPFGSFRGNQMALRPNSTPPSLARELKRTGGNEPFERINCCRCVSDYARWRNCEL